MFNTQVEDDDRGKQEAVSYCLYGNLNKKSQQLNTEVVKDEK